MYTVYVKCLLTFHRNNHCIKTNVIIASTPNSELIITDNFIINRKRNIYARVFFFRLFVSVCACVLNKFRKFIGIITGS